ncbi:MAG: hypothetical protein OXH57_08065, partial [Ekhidna sp.]|nr:hypothetical protein [Ekhidna sp.]
MLENDNQKYNLWLSGLLLSAIVSFAVFLRCEDFAVWKRNKAIFQYRGEFQMANFDSYYYLQIAKEIQEGTYDNLQENRRVPDGMQAPAIPPLMSLLAASISSITNIPLATVAIFLPVFLASFLAPLMFFFCRKLHFGTVAALTTALFSVISLTYVSRTRIGVFDTDCLNVVLLLLNSYLFFRFAEIKNNHRYVYLGLGFLNSFLFMMWWNTATSVVILSGIIPLSAAAIFFYPTKRKFFKYGILSLIILLCGYLAGDEVVSYVNLVLGRSSSSFPDNMSVAELEAIGINSFIKRTSDNKFIFIVTLVGMVPLYWKMRLKALFFAIPAALAVAPFFAGNRFILFSAPILAMGIGYAVQMLFNFRKWIKPSVAVIIT